MNKIILLLIILLCSSALYASSKTAGSTHHPSPWDLKYAFFNFIALFGFMIWKLKGSIREYFIKYAETIEEENEQAETKNREAVQKLDEINSKLDNVEKKVSSIVLEADEDASKIAERIKGETIDMIGRLEKDSENKLQYEKEQLVRSIKADFVDEILAKAKTTITDDKSIQKKTTEKLLSTIE